MLDPFDEELATLEVAGRPLEVTYLEGEEALSRLFRFDVVCADAPGGARARAMIGAAAAITLRDGFGTSRKIHGLVTEARRSPRDDGTIDLRLVVRPAIWTRSLGQDCRVFQDKTVVEIVKEVVSQGGTPTRWEVTGVYAPHVYCAQYREDDVTFVFRLLEEEGVYTCFDHGDEASTLVFADDSRSAPDLVGGASIQFAFETGMRGRGELIHELGGAVQATPTKFTVGSFDAQRPLLKVVGAAGKGSYEVYDAPGGGPESPAACAARAKILEEAAAAERSGVSGAATSVRLVPGMVFDVWGSRVDGRYLVTSARYKVTQRRKGASAAVERPYVCYFTAIPQGTPFRAPMTTRLATQSGLQSGVVVGPGGAEVHPDATGRVRVQLHWDRQGQRDESAGKWMRVAQRGTAESMLLPRIGWNVLTFNDEGTVDAPSVLSRIHDAEHPPTYSLPANKTRVVFKTATTPGGGSFNEVYFEDKKGAEEMFINASRDMSTLVQNVKSESVARDTTRTIGVDQEVVVTSQSALRVVGNQAVTVGGSETLEVGGARKKQVVGDESITIGGKRSVSTGSSHTTKVLGTRTLNVGAAMIDVCLGNIGAVSQRRTSVLVGGAHVKLTPAGITDDVGKVALYTVGGAKIEIAKQARVIDVKKRLFETVGGLIVAKTDGRYVDGAEEKAKWKVGGVLSASAPEVVVEAKDKIEVKCGSSVITVLPDSVEIRSSELSLSDSGALVAVTKLIEHN